MDGRVPVLDIGRHQRVWLLSVEDGDAVAGVGVRICHGFGASYPEPFSAVFVHDDRLWLQIGVRRWDVADISDVRQAKDGVRQAEYVLGLSCGARDTVRIPFPPMVSAFRIADPAHDELDSLSEDIMKLLPYTAVDGWRSSADTVAGWAARVKSMWAGGIPVPSSSHKPCK